jgi:eukaryotic-like serine/threonine-protein kinase
VRAGPIAPRWPDTREHTAEPAPEIPAAAAHRATAPRLAFPRPLWLAGTLLLLAWQAATGRPGLALLLAAALAPALVLSGPRPSVQWLSCALAPTLGYIGFAAAFPALAGQAVSWRTRAMLAAIGFWWLRLAEPLVGANLWLAPGASTPPRAAWQASLSLTAAHLVAPLLSVGVLLGALQWGAGAVLLPWLVRGRSAVRDALAVSAWAAALAVSAPALDGGLSAHTPHPDPRGAVLGAIVGALVAVAARALRGPV